MRHQGHTHIGGGEGGKFLQTQWTRIIAARNGSTTHRREIVGGILKRYWRPVYCYLRHKGQDNDTAKDSTQAFFTKILEHGERSLLHRADQTRGKFRTLLLTALDNFLRDEARKAGAAKRRPTGGWVSLEGEDGDAWDLPANACSPQEEYHRAWVSTLLDEVLAEVEAACCKEGKQTHWKIFDSRFLAPIRTGAQPSPLDDLCRKYEISDEKQASNMAVTVKRRFSAAMRRRVRQWVDTNEEVDEEIVDLMKILSRSGAANSSR